MENKNQVPKKKIYKRWWFWLIVIFVVIIVISSGGEKTSNPTLKKSTTESQEFVSDTNKGDGTDDIQIINIENKITEKNSVWWKFAWIVTLKNNTQKNQTAYIDLSWLDSDGFIVASNMVASECVISAGEEMKCKGYELIDVSVATNVEDIEVEIKDSIF